MSERVNRRDDYRNWWNLGGIVEFDGPDGERLQGEIVRITAGGYMHVEVNGERYEVTCQRDNVIQIGGW